MSEHAPGSMELDPKTVDRVAQALNDQWAANPTHGAFWDQLEPQEQEWWRQAARVAIQELVFRAGFDDVMTLARLIIDTNYPAEVFDRWPDDPGPRLVAALRVCDEARAR